MKYFVSSVSHEKHSKARFLLVTSLKPSGPVNVVNTFLEYQAIRGVSWKVVVLKKAPSIARPRFIEGHDYITFYQFAKYLIAPGIKGVPNSRIQRTNCLLFSHGLLPELIAVATKYTILAGKCTLVATLHNAVYEDYKLKWPRLGEILARFHCFLINKYDYAICCSSWLSDYYSKLLRQPIILCVPNCTSAVPAGMARLDSSLDYPQVLRPGNKQLQCITSSVLSSRKNIIESINLLHGFASSHLLYGLKLSKLEFVIAGSGPDYDDIHNRALYLESEFFQCSLKGELSQENLFMDLISSDLYISSSLSEGSPLGVLEALSFGCAAVLSDIPAHRDIYNKMDCSWVSLYKLGDSASFITALCRSISASSFTGRVDRSKYSNMYYSPSIMEAGYNNIFSSALSRFHSIG